MDLHSIYRNLALPSVDETADATFAVATVPEAPSFLIGKDSLGRAALLIETDSGEKTSYAAIRLQFVEAYFGVTCNLQTVGLDQRKLRLSVLECVARDDETVRFFLSICGTVISLLSDTFDLKDVWNVVQRLASLFQKLTQPRTQSLNGVFGELFLIRQSSDPSAMFRMWRVQRESRFDFVNGRLRLDAKTTSGNQRTHVLSYEQANPPRNTVGVFASMFVEQVGKGFPFRDLIRELEQVLAPEPELVFQLQERIAETLGNSLKTSLDAEFDRELTEGTLRFYLATDVPAIREDLPDGVSGVHFSSNFGRNCISQP